MAIRKLGILLATLALAGGLHAQEDDEYPAKDLFSEGKAYFTVNGGLFVSAFDGNENIGLGALGASFYIIDDFAVVGELGAAYLDAKKGNPDGTGAFFSLLGRWHYSYQDRTSFYLELGAGTLFSNKSFPDRGSHFNFMPQAGLGLTFLTNQDILFIFGIRWLHISNANLFDHNPGFDGLGGIAGLMFGF